ncbi:DMT family transporter [Candidatus Sulfidibacterium hydrothermale]|uniref:DMT family transporter n=1 Tax=Candidatus Sulfidibacterium hydrothermale TaxID=2875962 RepID=UPI001F0A9414|nr:DMT family transporter [Candidatus Sulfidibacterium hydrothermale]UBM63176.1 DMT family transporter [Candidatus Sulfidibacterium hydrothermale]
MKPLHVHIIAFISMFFWGMSYVWSKIVFEVYSPLTTIYFRLLISFVVLFIFGYATGLLKPIQKADRWLFLGSAFLNPFLYFIGENYGLSMVSASLSSIIVATIPLFAPFAGWFFFREKLKPFNIAGLILSFAGLLLILLNKDFELSANPWGILLLFLAVFSAVFYVVALKKLSRHYNAVTIIAWQNMLGSLYFLPFFLVIDGSSFVNIKPGILVIVSLLMLGIFASSVAFVLYTLVVKYLGVIKSSLYTNLIPAFTVIFSFYLLREEFSLRKTIGMIIVILGVILSETGKIPLPKVLKKSRN